MGDPETGVITCTARDDGDGGDPCAYYGTNCGGPSFGTPGNGSSGASTIAERARKERCDETKKLSDQFTCSARPRIPPSNSGQLEIPTNNLPELGL